MYDPYNEGKKTTKCDSICHCSFLDKLYSLTAFTHKCSLVPRWGSYIMKSTKRCHKKGLNKANEGSREEKGIKPKFPKTASTFFSYI